MTLKKQFSILASFIIAIPIFCVIFLFTYNYINSSDRILIKEYTQLKKNSADLYSQEDWQTIFESISDLPPDVDGAIISESNKILISTIPELPVGKEITFSFLWQIQNHPSKRNYFQFSIIQTSSAKMLLVTKIAREVDVIKRKFRVIPALFIFIFFVVTISFSMVLIIFKNINKSISTLETQTHEIADGDLSITIETDKKENKANEITSISKSLEQMRLSLLEAQNKQNKFIMGISHDLRTPVAIIKGYTEALSDGIITEPDELQNTYSLIQNKTNQLQNMIDSLINFMKLNYKEFRENLNPENLTTIINEFAQDAKISCNVFNRKIDLNINLSKDYFVPLNKTLISRVFENLLSNALRYTKEQDTITITAQEKSENELIVSIADTGIGIDEKDLKNIFDLFYRGTNSRREEGMGIGLSVVKNIIDTHNWEISVSSKKDEGSCFTITVPLSPSTPAKTDSKTVNHKK